MNSIPGIIIGIIVGITAAVLINRAIYIDAERENAELKKDLEELAADLNAYRVMAEWDKFENERAK